MRVVIEPWRDDAAIYIPHHLMRAAVLSVGQVVDVGRCRPAVPLVVRFCDVWRPGRTSSMCLGTQTDSNDPFPR
jgi:hypothetical protein